jgi:predicted DNA-binding transcriptional regulator AlpA
MGTNVLQTESLLTRDEAAAILRKKVSWLRYSERRRIIPFVKVGQAIRYRSSDLREWIAHHVVVSSVSLAPDTVPVLSAFAGQK